MRKRQTPIPPQKFGPDGQRLCRWCEEEVRPPRRTFCSPECVHEARIRSDPGYLRGLVFERDKGICAACGVDSNAAYRVWRAARKEARRFVDRLMGASRFDLVWDGREMVYARRPDLPPKEKWARHAALMEKWCPSGGWTSGRSSGWDMDHIVPVEHGGGSCGLENLQTLCHGCHKAKTARQAAERALGRAAVVDEPGGQMGLPIEADREVPS